MRVVAVTCYRNESDILEAFIRHTAYFCDEHVLLDHGSTDASPEIARKLKGEGLPLRLLEDPRQGNVEIEQSDMLLKLAVNELGADWVLALDADEFIQGAHDKSFLPPVVAGETPCLKYLSRNYFPADGDVPSVLNPVERITSRMKHEPWRSNAQWMYKVAVPGWLAGDSEGRIREGKHYFLLRGLEAPFQVSPDVYLAHFSIRSPVQYALKLVAKQLGKFHHIMKLGSELSFYDKHYEQLRTSYSAFAAGLHSMRVSYIPEDDIPLVRDPIRYLGGPLRHTPPPAGVDSLVGDILCQAEKMARGSGEPAADSGGAVPASAAMEVLSEPDGSLQKTLSIQTDRTVFQAVSVPLNCPPGTNALRINWRSEPGMVEISGITLYYDAPGVPPEEFDEKRLKSLLRITGVAVRVASPVHCRIMVSHQLAGLVLSGWKETAPGNPVEMVIRFRFENQFIAPVFLSPVVLMQLNGMVDELRKCRGELAEARRELEILNDWPASVYSTGTMIDFGSAGQGSIFLREGWSTPEVWGTWTDGTKSGIKLKLDEIPMCDLWLCAKLTGFVHPKNPAITANVSLNGERVATWMLKSASFTLFHAKIDAGKITRRECEIAFEILNPASPRDLGLSIDSRMLGMGLIQLGLSKKASAA